VIVRPRRVPTAERPARRRWVLLAGAGAGLAAATLATPAVAAISPPFPSVVVENWRGYSGPFHKTHSIGKLTVVADSGATDGRSLQLRLPARPGVGPRQGVEIAGNNLAFRYGTFGTRMKTANCAGQDRLGVVTGFLTYALDISDSNGNGLADNHEVDVEILCAQPEVIWMSLYTDYDERTDVPRKISRAVNLGTGQVLHNCYRKSWEGICEPLLPGENNPASVTPVPGFNSAEQYTSYSFTWQSNRVRFYASDAKDGQILLWDYQGPVSRIPQKPAMFLQNVWHTGNWDPLNGPARNQPQVPMSAFLDSTTLPLWTAAIPNWATRSQPNRSAALRSH
jgi:hypothetical protein